VYFTERSVQLDTDDSWIRSSSPKSLRFKAEGKIEALIVLKRGRYYTIGSLRFLFFIAVFDPIFHNGQRSFQIRLSNIR
jgi:hypothetical protein